MYTERQMRIAEIQETDRLAENEGFSSANQLRDPLWEALRGGDVQAFEAVFRFHYTSLLNYGLRFNRDADEVKDCIQILFLTIWERKHNLSASYSIRNYLMASLRRLVMRRLRSLHPCVDIDSDFDVFHAELSAEAKMIRDETLANNSVSLQAAIDRLPDRQKEALYLRFYDDQSFGDIAVIMDISVRAVYKLIYKALDALNSELCTRPGYTSFSFSSLLLFCSGIFMATRIAELSAVLLD